MIGPVIYELVTRLSPRLIMAVAAAHAIAGWQTAAWLYRLADSAEMHVTALDAVVTVYSHLWLYRIFVVGLFCVLIGSRAIGGSERGMIASRMSPRGGWWRAQLTGIAVAAIVVSTVGVAATYVGATVVLPADGLGNWTLPTSGGPGHQIPRAVVLTPETTAVRLVIVLVLYTALGLIAVGWSAAVLGNMGAALGLAVLLITASIGLSMGGPGLVACDPIRRLMLTCHLGGPLVMSINTSLVAIILWCVLAYGIGAYRFWRADL